MRLEDGRGVTQSAESQRKRERADRHGRDCFSECWLPHRFAASSSPLALRYCSKKHVNEKQARKVSLPRSLEDNCLPVLESDASQLKQPHSMKEMASQTEEAMNLSTMNGVLTCSASLIHISHYKSRPLVRLDGRQLVEEKEEEEEEEEEEGRLMVKAPFSIQRCKT
ncbi:hypothetical protein Baya_4682 [Bagarius yarrelli]|uniref:Uncharacterized protein n=1 Tax=Bagarius yarrelli TaxID=175774 RepID=A0A556TT87_BAGYA|nr:hypothetical protein Baya_4682 [Bagarius yarrelli]